MDNGPAHKTKEASKLREVSERIGDMIEDSRIRREVGYVPARLAMDLQEILGYRLQIVHADLLQDYENYRGQSIYEDLSQSGPGRARGYQGATAFLIMGSGLDEVRFSLVSDNENNSVFIIFCSSWHGKCRFWHDVWHGLGG